MAAMRYGSDPCMDEDGEALMYPDDFLSEREPLSYAGHQVADETSDEWKGERPPTQANNDGESLAGEEFGWDGSDDGEEEETTKKNKPSSRMLGKDSSSKKRKRKALPKPDRSVGKESSSRSKSCGAGSADHEGDPEEQELWDVIAGDNSEDEREGAETAYDDAFIDDTGVDRVYCSGSDNEAGSIRVPTQAEEDNEMNKLFKRRKMKKNKQSPVDLAVIIEDLLAELEVTAEEDAELNRQNKPAINKLKKLPLLLEVISKKKLQLQFLDHGVLTLLKNWLEPLPDGSLPNINIRTAILKLLYDFPIDLDQHDRREQLKKSGLGKVIMFLSRTDEETMANRKLARELVNKWSRPIFNKSIRFEDMRSYDEGRIPCRRPAQKPVSKSPEQEYMDDIDEFSQRKEPCQAVSKKHTSWPEAVPLDFVVRPQSKIDPEEVRARARAKQAALKNGNLNNWCQKIDRKVRKMKVKIKNIQAHKPNVMGRGMVKYI